MNDQVGSEAILAYIKRSAWTEGLSNEILKAFSEAAEFVEYKGNEVVQRAEDSFTAIYFVARGRIQQTIMDMFGRKIQQRPLIGGTAFGILLIDRPGPSNVSLVATEPSSLITLSSDQLHKLSVKYPVLQTNLYGMAGDVVRQLMMVDRTREQPRVVAIVHQSDSSREITPQLVRRLMQIENAPCVWSDDPKHKPIEGVEFQSIIEGGQLISVEQGRTLLKERSKRGRVFVDISARHELAALGQTIRFADTVLWCVRPNEGEQVLTILKQLENEVAGWREKIHLVWFLDDTSYLAPYIAELSDFVDHDFKITFSELPVNQGTLLSSGLERIIHYLRGVKIGIALGGGAARGMAHLGVLKALEQNGIYVDMVAGTSAGAMVGTLYAHGLDADYLIKSFVQDLRLPWIFRHLPGGGYWYLLYKYRLGQFDPMLRKYMGGARLEQLHIPMHTVTVDLASGTPVVREAGDAVRGIVESMNLPGLAAPILQGNKVLIDGGFINNIPADVLVAKGCNFVIASSVTAKMEQEFAGIRGDSSTERPSAPSTLNVIMRTQLVQNVNMNAVGVQPADFVIAPDVTAFDLSEFERTDEMAIVGERETRELILEIKQTLAKLDPQLFFT